MVPNGPSVVVVMYDEPEPSRPVVYVHKTHHRTWSPADLVELAPDWFSSSKHANGTNSEVEEMGVGIVHN